VVPSMSVVPVPSTGDDRAAVLDWWLDEPRQEADRCHRGDIVGRADQTLPSASEQPSLIISAACPPEPGSQLCDEPLDRQRYPS
jgi:hypothetical protein